MKIRNTASVTDNLQYNFSFWKRQKASLLNQQECSTTD